MRFFYGAAHLGKVLFFEGGKHPVGKLHFRVGFAADTNLYPWKIVAVQMVNDAFQSIVTAVCATSSDAQRTAGQRNIIENNNDFFDGYFIKIGRFSYGDSTVIHKSLGFYEKTAVAGYRCFACERFEFYTVYLGLQFLCQSVQAQVTDVVSGKLIFFAGIAQANNKIFGRANGRRKPSAKI